MIRVLAMGGVAIRQPTKGSVFYFQRPFPVDPLLSQSAEGPRQVQTRPEVCDV